MKSIASKVFGKLKSINESINLANKLTILRIILVPLFVVLLMNNKIPHNIMWALIVFTVASVTDFFDGYIARTRFMVTPLGQFLDPIADKVLVMSALVCFAGLGWIQSWIVVVILARDFIISGIRLIAVQSEEKIIIPARASGKVKTAITMATLFAIMALWMLTQDFKVINANRDYLAWNGLQEKTVWDPPWLLCPIGNALMYFCVALTVFSGLQYIWDARDVLKKELTDN